MCAIDDICTSYVLILLICFDAKIESWVGYLCNLNWNFLLWKTTINLRHPLQIYLFLFLYTNHFILFYFKNNFILFFLYKLFYKQFYMQTFLQTILYANYFTLFYIQNYFTKLFYINYSKFKYKVNMFNPKWLFMQRNWFWKKKILYKTRFM